MCGVFLNLMLHKLKALEIYFHFVMEILRLGLLS